MFYLIFIIIESSSDDEKDGPAIDNEFDTSKALGFTDFDDLFSRANENAIFLLQIIRLLEEDYSDMDRSVFADNYSPLVISDNDEKNFSISNAVNKGTISDSCAVQNNAFPDISSKLKTDEEYKELKKANKTRYLSIKFKKKYGIDIQNKNKQNKKMFEQEADKASSGNKDEKPKRLLDDEISWNKNKSLFLNASNKKTFNNSFTSNNLDYKSSGLSFLKIKLDKSEANVNPDHSLNSSLNWPLNPEAFADPVHIKDCILGLNSQYPERAYKTLRSLPAVIASQPYDLDFSLENLSEILLKFTNEIVDEKYKKIDPLFNMEKLIQTILAQLTVFSPIKMTQILCKRFFLEESGMKQKFDILNVILKSCEFLNKEEKMDLSKMNFYEKERPKNKINKQIIKIPDEINTCNNQTSYMSANDSASNTKFRKNNVGKINNLFPFIEYIVFPLLRYLEKKNIEFLLKIKEMDFLLAKFLLVIAKIIFFSENYPKIYQVLFESFELFKSVSCIKENSVLVIDSLNFYVFVVGKFINQNFIDIYPEFNKNFKFCLEFLKRMLDEIHNDEIKFEIVKNLNFYVTSLKKLRHVSVLAMEGMDQFLIN